MIALTVRASRAGRGNVNRLVKFLNTTQTLRKDDSQDDIKKVLDSYEPQKKKLAMVKKKQMQKAENVFNILKSYDHESKGPEESDAGTLADGSVKNTVKTLSDVKAEKSDDKGSSTEGFSERMKDLMRDAEVTEPPELEEIDLNGSKNVKQQKFDENKMVLERARKIAIELGIDVEQTQSELLDAYKAMNGRQGHVLSTPKVQDYNIEKRTRVKPKSVMKLVGPRLDIFQDMPITKEEPSILETWKELKNIELLSKTVTSPNNYFDELINWTTHGKLWHFPIDNEQGLDEEKKVDFTEHIFLDQHLEPWCPKFGPIRHFMELVCVGLSKNHYMSAAKKKEHIMWYKTYFESKKKLLNELGVLNASSKTEGEKTAELENPV